MVPYGFFFLNEPEKIKLLPRLALVLARTAVKFLPTVDIAQEKSNPTLWTPFLKLERQCRGP